MNLTKTYNTIAKEPIASKVNWDNSNNGMNDYWATVSTDADTEVHLYSGTDYQDTSLIVPAGSINFDVAAHGFEEKVASFKVLPVAL